MTPNNNSEKEKMPPVDEKTIVSRKQFIRFKKFYEQHPHGREKLTLGQKAADLISEFGGSWIFIISFMLFIGIWITINLYWLMTPVDPFPFILLNLMLSMLAALQAPVILMSQHRQTQRDRLKAERDHFINRKAEKEVANMQQDLEQIKQMIRNIHTVTGCDEKNKITNFKK